MQQDGTSSSDLVIDIERPVVQAVSSTEAPATSAVTEAPAIPPTTKDQASPTISEILATPPVTAAPTIPSRDVSTTGTCAPDSKSTPSPQDTSVQVSTKKYLECTCTLI